jgi:hypothetical protein
MEESRAPVYVFVRNAPVNVVDPFGLSGCCGPDVSSAIQNTLSQIETTYNSWNILKKGVVCTRMITLPWAVDAWDMFELAALGFSETAFVFAPPAQQGTGTCKQTVAYGGKCYKSNAANYMTWGKMNRLCHGTFDPIIIGFPPIPINRWGLSAAVVTTWAWKGIYGWADVGQAIDFTKAGFNGGGPTGAGCLDCLVVPGNVAGNAAFQWKWEPYKTY